jgi:ubiquitin C-terminal hydrolase
MERAIQLSLKEQSDREQFQEEIKGGRGYKDPENPFDRKRESLEIPAGIKNVGNTCYINSLLQAIFLIPHFRINIFDLNGLVDQSASPGERLIRELQLLFSRMLLTNRRYVDPQPLLEFTSHHGAQEDPTELFLALLEKIRDGAMKRTEVRT